MKKVIMGIGVPGSGKTTFLKSFAERNNYDYVCPDDIRQKITKSAADQNQNKEVWQIAYHIVANLLAQGKTVVFDATFVKENDRLNFIKFVKEKGAEKIQGVYLDVPSEIAKERNTNRERVVPEYAMDRMIHNLDQNPPKIDEGFDSIFTLDELQQLTEAEKIQEGETGETKILHKTFEPKIR